MSQAKLVSPHFDELGNRFDSMSGPTVAAWRVAWFLLQSVVQPDGLGAMLPNGHHATAHSVQTELLLKRASVDLRRLITSTRGLAIASSLSAAVPLIGAGPGLTPSWDDLLIGYICGLRTAASGHASRGDYLSRFGEAIHKASSATTYVSRWYIERSIRGYGPQWIEDVLAAIGTGDLQRTNVTTRQALGMGSTSGTDMMIGTLLGCSIWRSGSLADEVLTVLSCRAPHYAHPNPVGIHGTH